MRRPEHGTHGFIPETGYQVETRKLGIMLMFEKRVSAERHRYHPKPRHDEAPQVGKASTPDRSSCNHQPFAPQISSCCRANSAHVRLSRPDSGLGSQIKALKKFQVVPSSLVSAPHTPPPTPKHQKTREEASYRPRGAPHPKPQTPDSTPLSPYLTAAPGNQVDL